MIGSAINNFTEEQFQRAGANFSNYVAAFTNSALHDLHEGQKIYYELAQVDVAATPVASGSAQELSFGPVMERTLRINGDECDFLVLRTGEVLHHSRVDPAEMRNDTPLVPFVQWVRNNGVDVGFCSTTNEQYAPFGLTMFYIGILPFPYDTVPHDNITRFRTLAELIAYNASHHDRPAENPFVDPLLGGGVTNIWNDLTADLLCGSPEVAGSIAALLKEKLFSRWLQPNNAIHPVAFSTREGVTGLLQVTSFTTNPPVLKLRYKLVQTNTPAAFQSSEPATCGKPKHTWQSCARNMAQTMPKSMLHWPG